MAMMRYASMKQNDEGVEKNEEEGRYYFRMAIENGVFKNAKFVV